MSKKVIKIISLSLLAVIIPVAVIVVIACLSSAKTYSLTIDTIGYENKGTVKFLVNGEDYKEGMKFLNGSKVTIKVESDGYKVDGWYDCESCHVTNCTEKVEGETRTFTIEEDTTISVKVNRIVYTVIYDKKTEENADNSSNTKTIEYGESLSKVTEELEDKQFIDGWYFDADGNNQIDVYEKQNVYAYAIFPVEDASNTVISLVSNKQNKVFQYVYNNEEGEAEYDEKIEITPKSKTGEHFVGWEYKGEKFTDSDAKIIYKKYDKNITTYELTPKYETNQYYVKYDDATESVSVSYDDELRNLTKEDGIAAGKYFAGWKVKDKESVYTSANFPEDIINGSTVDLSSVIEDKKYNILYKGANSDPEVDYNEDLPTTTTETNKGNHFIGWSVEDGNSEKIVTKATFAENYDGKTTITLYPIWKKNIYKVTYRCDDKSIEKSVEYGEKLAKAFTNTYGLSEFNSSLKAGDCFVGSWKQEETEYTTADFDFADGASIELTAVVRKIKYNVIYKKGSSVEVEYGSTLKVGESNLTTGEVFDHWIYENDEEEDVSVKDNIAIFAGYKDGDTITLKAATKNLYENAYKLVTIEYSYINERKMNQTDSAIYKNKVIKDEENGSYSLEYGDFSGKPFDAVSALKDNGRTVNRLKFSYTKDSEIATEVIEVSEKTTIKDIIDAYKKSMEENDGVTSCLEDLIIKVKLYYSEDK